MEAGETDEGLEGEKIFWPRAAPSQQRSQPRVPALDMKEVGCPDTSTLSQCSVLIGESIFEVSSKDSVPCFVLVNFDQDVDGLSDPPQQPAGIGPIQDTTASLGLALGDCLVVDSWPHSHRQNRGATLVLKLNAVTGPTAFPSPSVAALQKTPFAKLAHRAPARPSSLLRREALR